ncbi:antibiotic biosynthesis monooxygenase [Sphingorhabdus sp. Alg231-15]|uniref:antibiotic biosynthesis monooxygenase n=1 Tax=Sphingorhabdus sp. Alg231-15 TaxID=1922222 RepID=UPI000D562C6A
MTYVLIIHEVDNYADWKSGFDQVSNLRKTAGEIEFQILSYDDDPNKVVHFSKWQTTEKARAFFESAKVKEIREELGVNEPEFIYLDERESGIL